MEWFRIEDRTDAPLHSPLRWDWLLSDGLNERARALSWWTGRLIICGRATLMRSWHRINVRLTSQDELLFLFIGLTNRYRQFHLSIDQKEYAIECNWCHIYWMGVTCLNLQQTLSWRSIFDYEQVKIWTTENETRERGWTLLSNRKRIYLTINLEHMSLWVLGFEGDLILILLCDKRTSLIVIFSTVKNDCSKERTQQ